MQRWTVHSFVNSASFKMSHYFVVVVTLLVLLGVVRHGDSARILGIFPTASISHQVVFRALTLELNKRGHELVVLTPDPVNDPTLKNYTEIDVSFFYDHLPEVNYINNRKIHWLSFFMEYAPLSHMTTETILSQPGISKLYAPNSQEKFDLIFIELLFCPALLYLAQQLDAPVIGIASLGLAIHQQYDIGNPILSSHPSVWELGTRYSGSLSFWQRLTNFIDVWRFIYHYRTDFIQKQETIARKYFGNDIPSLYVLERNVSLIFENQQKPIAFVKPMVPNVIEIGGLHVSKQTTILTKDLQKLLDEATQGFVYMSLGSNVKSNMLSHETRAEFMAAFGQLPYLVIWKFEDDLLPGKPDNVVIINWAPQQAILAHPNLKVFIYQGGLQSTEEAISHGVPLVGFPVLGDQDMQINKMVSLGVAKKLEITSVNRHDLLEAVRTVALDNGYKERMLNLRSLLKDTQLDPLKNAIWWTEFVIKHKGAPHLHSSTADEPWYTRQDMDVIAFISAGSVIVLSLTLVILYQSLAFVMKAFNTMSKGKKQKRN